MAARPRAPGGYLLLAEMLSRAQAAAPKFSLGELNPYACAFNFGPSLEANRSARAGRRCLDPLQPVAGSFRSHRSP